MKCTKVLERMINQNNHDEIAQGDCRLLVCVISIMVLLQISSSMTTELMNLEKMKAHSFLCGNSHSLRPRSWTTRRCAGTRPTVISLLPVSVHVRVEWREEYFIGISFLDEMCNQAQNGVICIFSLKNPSYPEYLCWAESGVMCLDFHQQVRGECVDRVDSPSQHPHMLVVGLHNGNVAVYNLQTDPAQPVYRSCASNGKHQDIVWKVRAETDQQQV